MNILLICGHGDGDCGAVANGYQEQYLTREFAKILKDAFAVYDCHVDIAPDSRNYYTYLQKHGFDFSYYHYVIEIHFNAGGGSGVEMFVPPTTTGTSVEKAITKYVSTYTKLKNRGVKYGNYYVIKKIKRSGTDAGLLEVCFIDSKRDMEIYETEKEKIAQAVADGTAKGFGLKKKKGEKKVKVYNTLEEVPESYQPAIKRLIHRGLLKGDGTGLNLSEEMCRIFTILDRAGVFGSEYVG